MIQKNKHSLKLQKSLFNYVYDAHNEIVQLDIFWHYSKIFQCILNNVYKCQNYMQSDHLLHSGCFFYLFGIYILVLVENYQ